METALIKQETASVLSQAQDIVTRNQQSVEKAREVCDVLIEKINHTTIADTPDVRQLDEECKNLLGKLSKTVSALNERRKPITQAFDQVRKYFTDLENELKTGERIQKIQEFRNKFAKYLADEEEKLREEQKIKAQTEEERISIRAYAKQELVRDFTDTLSLAYGDIEYIFNSIDLTNSMTKKEELEKFSSEYKTPSIQYPFLCRVSQEEHDQIVSEVCNIEIAKLEAEYKGKIIEKTQYYIDRVQSRVKELLEIAKADDEKKARLQKEAEERARKEAEAKKQELLNFSQKQQATIEAEKTEASLGSLFDQQYTPQTANVKKTLEIEVLNPAGYGQIFMFWFEREGKNLPSEKIEKKSIAQMKKFCEDTANKNGEIIESPSIRYKEVVTAR